MPFKDQMHQHEMARRRTRGITRDLEQGSLTECLFPNWLLQVNYHRNQWTLISTGLVLQVVLSATYLEWTEDLWSEITSHHTWFHTRLWTADVFLCGDHKMQRSNYESHGTLLSTKLMEWYQYFNDALDKTRSSVTPDLSEWIVVLQHHN